MRDPAFGLAARQAGIERLVRLAGQLAQFDGLYFGHLFFRVGAQSKRWIKRNAVSHRHVVLLGLRRNATTRQEVPASPCIRRLSLAIMQVTTMGRDRDGLEGRSARGSEKRLCALFAVQGGCG